MASGNGSQVLFCPPGFKGLDGKEYKLVRFGGLEFHKEGVKALMAEQAEEHGSTFGEDMIGPLTEALMDNRCKAVLCTTKSNDSPSREEIVAMMSYTKDISKEGAIYFLEDIVVKTPHRNKSIGTKCISSLIIHAKKKNKDGMRLHTKSNNYIGKRLFNRFGNIIFDELPSVMEIPPPEDSVVMPKTVAPFGPEHMNQAYQILASQLNFTNVRLLSDVAYGRIDGAEGIVSLNRGQITGVALMCMGFGTISCTKNTHINTIASIDIEHDIPDLIEGMKYTQKIRGRQGSIMIDFRDNAQAIWSRLSYLSKLKGASVYNRAGARMISGSICGDVFSDAVKTAKRSLALTKADVLNGETSRPKQVRQDENHFITGVAFSGANL